MVILAETPASFCDLLIDIRTFYSICFSSEQYDKPADFSTPDKYLRIFKHRRHQTSMDTSGIIGAVSLGIQVVQLYGSCIKGYKGLLMVLDKDSDLSLLRCRLEIEI